MTAEHGLVVKTHWKTNAAQLRGQLQTSQQDAERQATETRDAFAIRAGIEAFVARAALDLLDEILKAAEDAEGALPIPLTRGHHLILDGTALPVINSWIDTSSSDGRQRWGIVTESKIVDRWGADQQPAPRETEEQPAPPADATAPRCDSHECMSPNCAFPGKCVRVKVADATRGSCTGCSDPQCWTARADGGDA